MPAGRILCRQHTWPPVPQRNSTLASGTRTEEGGGVFTLWLPPGTNACAGARRQLQRVHISPEVLPLLAKASSLCPPLCPTAPSWRLAATSLLPPLAAAAAAAAPCCSGDYLVMFDPHAKYLPGVSPAQPGLKIAFARAALLEQFPDAFTPFAQLGCSLREHFKGRWWWWGPCCVRWCRAATAGALVATPCAALIRFRVPR